MSKYKKSSSFYNFDSKSWLDLFFNTNTYKIWYYANEITTLEHTQQYPKTEKFVSTFYIYKTCIKKKSVTRHHIPTK